jgi:hypothetical protein
MAAVPDNAVPRRLALCSSNAKPAANAVEEAQHSSKPTGSAQRPTAERFINTSICSLMEMTGLQKLEMQQQ